MSLPREINADDFESKHRYERLQAGLDLLDQGITVIDAKLHMVAWNKTFLTLLDFPTDMAFVGAPFESFIRYNAERGEYGPGDIDELVRVRVDAARTFQPHYTERQRPDGRTLAIRGEPILNHGFVTLYTDVTEQRRYEQLIEEQTIELNDRVRARTHDLEAANEGLRYAARENQRINTALRLSEARMRMVTDNVAALIGYFDRSQIYSFANLRHSDWFGREHDDIIGRPLREIVGRHTYQQVEPYVRRALGGEYVAFEIESPDRQGRVRNVRCTFVPDVDSGGSVIGCYVLAVDVSEQKRAEAGLREAQKMEAIGQLSGGMAHDFNNILTVIIGNLRALESECTADLAVRTHIPPALRAAQRGAELVKRLLTIARQQPLERAPVDVGALILGMSALLRSSLPESIELRTRIGSSTGPGEVSVWAMSDPGQLENALINLALNSRDAMPAGGVLEIACARAVLAADARREFGLDERHYVEIVVSDTGCGMDEATQARAFDPFFTTKAFGRGSGLGLSMVRGFVQQSGGAIVLHSKADSGTSIHLYLPAVESPATPVSADDAEDGERNLGLVLLVEDDADVRAVVRDMVISLGYTVIEAENGVEALELVGSLVDIKHVLSDMVMPGGLDGHTLAWRIRETNPDVGLVLMSGYAGPGPGETESQLRVPFLNKPFSVSQLRSALKRSLA